MEREKRLDEIAASLLKERKAHLLREKGFIYRHGRRVAVSVVALRGRITDDDSHDEALRIAALFHDVGKGIEPHARSGALLAGDALQGCLPPELLAEVVTLIGEHTNHRTDNPWAKILQDADLMDHFGSLEVGLSFQYGAYTEEGMDATADWYANHFDAYVERVRSRVKYPQSLPIFEEKVAFTRAFVRRFLVEYAGGYVEGLSR